MRLLRIFLVVLVLAQVLPAWGQAPIFQAPSPADVGSNLVGQGVIGAFSAAIFITNTGTAPLTISGATTSGEFALFQVSGEPPHVPQSIAPGQSDFIPVSVISSSAGTKTGTLTVTDNAAGSPHQIQLNGFAVGPNDFGWIFSSSSVTVSAGTTAFLGFTAIGGGSFSGRLTLSCSLTAPAASCTTPPVGDINPGTNFSFSLPVTTTAAAALPASRPGLPPNLIAVLGLVAVVSLRMRGKRALTALAGATFLLVLASCGGSSPRPATTRNPGSSTPAGTYTVTVTGTDGNISRSVTTFLVVK
jgi:hypothetical protein